jgi:hypothetical protein
MKLDDFLNNDIMVIDDLLNEDDILGIKTVMTDMTFPWYLSNGNYTCDESVFLKRSDENTYENYQFTHVFFDGETDKSTPYFRIIDCILTALAQKYEKNFCMNRIKANLQSSQNTELKYNTPHKNIEDLDHIIVLYYVNDADSKTFIFENEEKPWKIKHEIECKAGRVLIFNGKHYHTGMHPKNSNYKIVINFNVVNIEEIKNEDE